jgi:DNA mismatch repair protein MutS2
MLEAIKEAENTAINTKKGLLEESLRQLEFENVLRKIKTYCYSEPGAELIMDSLPSDNLPWLEKEHEAIREMVDVIQFEDSLPFDGFTDVRKVFHKSLVEGSVLNSTEVLAAGDMIRVFRLLRNFFSSRQEKYPELWEIASNLHENRLLEKHIHEAIDDAGEVKDTATRELQQIRQTLKSKSHALRNRLEKILKKTVQEDIVQEDFYTIREGRFVLPVKAENKRTMPGIIHGISQTGSTVFLEPSEIIEMNNELSLLQSEEQREIYRILSNLTQEIRYEARQFLSSNDIAAHIDSIRAKARYANDFNGQKPEITDRNYIFLNEVRHPLLVHSKGLKNVIPLSIEFTGDKRGHLISGPNAGGKTVALKSVGLNIAMALSGIFPLGECKTNFREIFTSIGDHQSIENDLSTFSSQMLQMKKVLDSCDDRSLVLVDEIGSGTDPQEGAALAAAILDSFINVNLFFIATTHQSSLKTYALNRDEIENASLEFDDEKLKPTYNFQPGIPGNSYAFVLADNIGISTMVIARAKKYLGKKQKELEESITILQKYRMEAVRNRTEAEKEKIKYRDLNGRYEEKLSKIQEKRKELLDKAREDAYNIVANSNALIEKTIKEIREEKRQISDIKKDFNSGKKEIEKEFKRIEQESREDSPTEEVEFKTGDTVSMEGSGSRGTIIEADPDNQSAVVDFNGLKFKVGYEQLKIERPEKQQKRDTADYIKFSAVTRLDIRGMRAGDALMELDNFISDALLNSVPQITIVHGKGTGALRQAVHDTLKNHPSIREYRLGELTEGGAGVTVAVL